MGSACCSHWLVHLLGLWVAYDVSQRTGSWDWDGLILQVHLPESISRITLSFNSFSSFDLGGWNEKLHVDASC
jgi:hypothetical protein